MRFGDKTTIAYFSVTYSAVIGQIRCIPQVCYVLGADIRATVEKMARDGLARIYDEEVRFISGEPVAIKKPERKPTSSAPKLPVIDVASGKKKKGKKSREFE